MGPIVATKYIQATHQLAIIIVTAALVVSVIVSALLYNTSIVARSVVCAASHFAVPVHSILHRHRLSVRAALRESFLQAAQLRLLAVHARLARRLLRALPLATRLPALQGSTYLAVPATAALRARTRRHRAAPPALLAPLENTRTRVRPRARLARSAHHRVRARRRACRAPLASTLMAAPAPAARLGRILARAPLGAATARLVKHRLLAHLRATR